jgi:hypothetical protein
MRYNRRREVLPAEREQRFWNTLGVISFIYICAIIAGLFQKLGCWMEETIKHNYLRKCSHVCLEDNSDCIKRCLSTFYKK